MAIDERSRHILFLKLEEVLGSEEATTLMEHLPPVGWADVATKRDLDQLAVATKRDIDQLAGTNAREHKQLAETFAREHQRLAESFVREHQQLEERITLGLTAAFRAELLSQTRTMIFALVSTVVALSGAFAGLHFL
jgi:hypothetical protein